MTKEQKLLLRKDLCGRLPYGVIVQSRIIDFHTEESAHDHYPNHVKHPSYVGNGRLFLIDTLSNSVSIRPILKNLTYREQVFFEDICKNGYIPIDECKPYLLPLSNMTKEQRREFYEAIRPPIIEGFEEDETLDYDRDNENRPVTQKLVAPDVVETDWLNAHHFDYRGLIEQGLAIDATGLEIYNKKEQP